RVVAIFGVQGLRWDWARAVRAVVFALEPAAYGGHKDVSEAWVAGVLMVDVGPAAAATGSVVLAIPPHLRESWAERVAIMVAGGGPPARGSRAPGGGRAPGFRRRALGPARARLAGPGAPAGCAPVAQSGRQGACAPSVAQTM